MITPHHVAAASPGNAPPATSPWNLTAAGSHWSATRYATPHDALRREADVKARAIRGGFVTFTGADVLDPGMWKRDSGQTPT